MKPIEGKFEAHLKIVKEEKLKRDLILNLQRGLLHAQSETDSYGEIKKNLTPVLSSLFSASHSSQEKTAKERVSDAVERMRKEMAGEVESTPPENIVYLGIGKAEEALGYVDSRDLDNLIVVGAPTSCGKSALMRQILCENLRRHEDWVIVGFLLESSIEDFCKSAACSYAGVNTRANLSLIGGEKQKKMYEFAKWMLDQVDERLFLYDSSATIEEIKNKCVEIKSKCGRLDLIAVDYMQIADRDRKGNSEVEVAAISRGCKLIQKEMMCPLFSGTQLNDDGRSRESRAIENDSTRFWVMERPDKTPSGGGQGDGFECDVYYQTLSQKKFRNGKKTTVGIAFDVTTQVMRDWN
jgi:replicative DNA helicase